jgi:uncharacterized protein with FMN-binding domain
MPRRGAFALGFTALALVLLLNFQTPGATPADHGTGVRPGAAGIGTGVAGAGAAGAAPNATGRAASGTVTGSVVDTRFGPVQVSITVSGGHVTDIVAIQLPNGDRRSSSISSRAEPVLRSQALQAQSAKIDGVSGATYTSDAYEQSLQAALDSAGI